ncbi:GNAT family N-acetyltransferase [Variovorax saccharolyticus]|uniref:GNAT family N-acetyltransferase n=1 Tax=Variovorax saccharolyticus TaxID=3053516 RepID=UPI0025765CB4|nr:MULTISPECIES: GNAT family N-acetyltransferase [unclassified Variovorax]MDM0022338.1 GNAT family N-acetyltransferase [Variovorax sp. J22R187]MDM0028894.1 GNAT family N-acetyltransferase [Variovorax sp. J31P216]
MNVVYRNAVPEDTPACFDLRGMTRENAFSPEQLGAIGVTPESWEADIRTGLLFGFVGLFDQKVIGYCFGVRDTGEVGVLALLPEYEGLGIGKALLGLVVDEFRRTGVTRLFLGCSTDPRVRSHGFYRHLGWIPTGAFDALNDEVLEYLLR